MPAPLPAGVPERLEAFSDVLARHGLTGAAETPLAHDGWSGARLSHVGGAPGFVIKRDSLAWDWIARATDDGPLLREAWFAVDGPALPSTLWKPYLGAGLESEPDAGSADPGARITALLMPDLTGTLLPWERGIDVSTLDRVLGAMAALHAGGAPEGATAVPWCPLKERLLLLSRPAAERYRAEDNPVGDRFIAGWDAFERYADPAAVELVARVSHDPVALLGALGRLPSTLIHGDLKLGNVGLEEDGRVALVDWQMVAIAPIAFELGWFLVSNVASLPLPPEAVLARYRAAAIDTTAAALDPDTWAVQVDLAWLVGLVLRGWRKGLDAGSGTVLASGVTAAEDLRSWCIRALEAADRRL